jgi:hypothetical protein
MQGSAITYAMVIVSPGTSYIAQPNREKQFRSCVAPSPEGTLLPPVLVGAGKNTGDKIAGATL